MNGFLGRLKKAATVASSEWQPGSYEIVGRKIVCNHCGGDIFAEGSALLNTSGMSFVGLDWANSSATTLSCTNCSKIEWFHKQPTRL